MGWERSSVKGKERRRHRRSQPCLAERRLWRAVEQLDELNCEGFGNQSVKMSAFICPSMPSNAQGDIPVYTL